MSTFDLTQKVKIVNPNASNDSQYGPYNSIGEALTETEGLRELGRTVGIIESGVITEYWFKEGITDEDLIPKTIGSNGSGGYFKEITKDGEFTAEKITGGINDGKYRFKITGDETLEWTIGDTDYVYNLNINDEWTFIADALGPNVQRRIDAVSYGNDGQVHYWKGTEIGQASYPNVPENHILKTFVTLTEEGATVTIPNTFDPTWLLRTDANWNIKSIPSGDSKIILGNVEYFGGRAFKIVDSEEDSTITGIVQYSTPTLTNIFLGSDGVMIYLWNDSENDITIKNFPTGTYSTNGYRFWFPIEGDYILKPDEVIYFKWHRVGLNPVTIDYNLSKFVFLGSNMSSGGPLSADQVSYDNTVYEILSAENVQDAIDEIISILPEMMTYFIPEPSLEGTPGQVLTTDGEGGRSWTTPGGGITELTGDVTASGSGSVVATIADNAVTPEKLSGKNYVRFSEVGVDWTSASSPQNNFWQSVTYGDSKFVAVSSNGTNRAMYSTDGITWLPATATGASNWSSVTYGNGKFVAVANLGTNRVMHSTDGITWSSAVATEANAWSSVTYGNGKFVAVSPNGTNRVMYSTNGVTWTSASASEASQWQSVTYGNGKFVAVSSNIGTNRVMYSTDGITWNSASAPEANQWESVTYGDGKFVAVASNGTNRVMYSTDGITWTSTSASEANSWSSVTYGDGRFVAVANFGTNRVMYSDDGITWTSASATEANGWSSVTYGNDKFVAVANTGTNQVMYSESGLNFDIPTSALINDGDGTAGQFLSDPLGGTSGQVLTTDGSGGVSWTTVSSGDGLPSPTANQFLVGNSAGTDWEKRRLVGSDVGITVMSNNYVPYWNANAQSWNSGLMVSQSEQANSLAGRTGAGQLRGANAVANNDLVPLGQLEGMLHNYVELTGNQTIEDLKTFTTSPLVPSKTTAATNTGTAIATEAQVFTKADDNAVVKLSGNQTIAGVKTFSSSPIVPTATTTTQAVNKGQMDTALTNYVNAGTGNTTGGGFSLDKVVLRNNDTGRTTTITKPNTDPADSNITIPGFGGGTKVIPISVNGLSAGPSGDITIPLGIEVDKFIGVTLGGSSPSININFAASNPSIINYEEIEISIQFLEKPATTTDFRLTFNSNNSPIYNTILIENADLTSTYTNQPGFRFKYDSDNGFYTFKVKNHPQTGIPRIITGSGVEFGDSSTYPKTWTLGGGFHSNDNITSLQIYSLDNTTNVPNMRVTVKKTF